MVRVAAILAVACVGLACKPGPLPDECAVFVAPSVIVYVSSGSDVPVVAATVSFTSDGGESGVCDERNGGEYYCGDEVEGLLTITVEKPSFATQVHEVQVGADRCHVLTESLEVVLEPEVCTDEQVVSVLARVEDGAGAPVPGASVRWRPSGQPANAALDCVASGNASFPFACGYEQAGELTLVASAGGFVQAVQEVTVEATFCHVITEEVVLVMQPL